MLDSQLIKIILIFNFYLNTTKIVGIPAAFPDEQFSSGFPDEKNVFGIKNNFITFQRVSGGFSTEFPDGKIRRKSRGSWCQELVITPLGIPAVFRGNLFPDGIKSIGKSRREVEN